MKDETVAYLAIERLQRSYADIATRHAWEEVASLATPDARFSFDTRTGQTFQVDGPAAFAEFGAKMTGTLSFYEYIPLNFVVEITSDETAHGRTYSLEVAEERESGAWIDFYGVYADQYVILDGSWRFSRRHYRTYGRRTAGRLEAFPLHDSSL
jgi:SnoaL-like domain